MSNFIAKLGFGVTLILFGLRLFFKPQWYAILRDTHMDFSDHHRFWGVVCILAGGIFLWIVLQQRVKKRKGVQKAGEKEV